MTDSAVVLHLIQVLSGCEKAVSREGRLVVSSEVFSCESNNS